MLARSGKWSALTSVLLLETRGGGGEAAALDL